ncbi:MAG: STAS domain-containing protein [Chloroflexota bacterium]
MDMNIKTSHGVTIVELEGRFDAYTAPPVKQKLGDLAAGGQARIVVSMSGVSFVDSTGLSTLVSGLKRCRQGGGDLKIAALQQPVRIIFELTRLDKAFEIFSDVEAALNSFGG